MPVLVAFASLPFGLREATYDIETSSGPVTVHVSAQRFNPFLSISPRPELAQRLPEQGAGEGYTTYTWYDHPFVLRVVFGRNVAALGSINSGATIVRYVPDTLELSDNADLNEMRDTFAEEALEALNNLVAVVRRKARLYHLFDLRRDDIDLTVRDETGRVLIEDPLQEQLIREEEAQSEDFDLLDRGDDWYSELAETLRDDRPIDLADELLIEAERALVQRFPRQAIATCHTTIEAAASALLTKGMSRRGLDDEAIDHSLSTRSLTSKLAALMGRFCGFNLRNDNRALWQAFGQLNDMRNDIVHRGMRPTEADAELAISTTRSVLDWMRMVRQRNR